MTDFNLVAEKWIPCLMLDFEPREFGLLETLTRAHEIGEITDDSPLITVALHRLLLAILHRNFGPKDFSAWKELWKCGRWDGEKLSTYFNDWKHRFNLFDEHRPFYQVPRMRDEGGDVKKDTLEILMQEAATGNNATLFNHSFSASPVNHSTAIATRYLVARQAFSVPGGNNKPFNLSSSTLFDGLSVLVLGNNLFETLALNLIPYYEDKPIACQTDEDDESLDKPFWEREKFEQATKEDKDGTVPLGYLDYLTWQSRRIHLIQESESTNVRYCQLQQNFKLPEKNTILDPFKCYVIKETKGLSPMGVDANKALWRDSHTLFQVVDEAKKRPQVFNHLAQLEKARRQGDIEGQRAYSFAVYGLGRREKTDKVANIGFWTHERLPLPLAYLNENNLVENIEVALNLAKDFAEKLRSGVRTLANQIVPLAGGDSRERQKKVTDWVNNFGAQELYWSRLDSAFKKLLIDLPLDFQETENTSLRAWAQTLERTARDSFSQTVNSLSGSSTELKAIAVAERIFYLSMKKIKDGNSHLFPTKNFKEVTYE